MTSHDNQLRLARLSLDGLSIGDAFGDQFFMHADSARQAIRSQSLPDRPWLFTDDTNMALSIYENLRLYGVIDQNALAVSFARHYDLQRDYGPAMHSVMRRIAAGEPWYHVAPSLFDGQGSYGNGAAMRVAPIGACFADDMDAVIGAARQSAIVTHAHPEGIAGAIAVAVAAAIASRLDRASLPTRYEFIERIIPHVPDSEVLSGIRRARDLISTDIDVT